MAGLPDYNVQDHAVNWQGHNFTGLAEGGVVINPEGDVTETVRGLGPNDVSATYLGVQGATIEVNLMQSSPTNAFLAEILAAQETQGILVKGPMRIFSPNNVYSDTQEVYIQSAPPQGFSKSQAERTWTFYCSKLRYGSELGGTSFSAGIRASLDVDVQFAIDTSFNFKL